MFLLKKFTIKQISDIKKYGARELFKKIFIFLNLLLRLPLYFIGLNFNIFLRIIRPIKIIRIGRVPSINFGDFASTTAMYYCKNKINNNKNFFDIVFLSDGVFNKQLEKMWKRELFFLPRFFLRYIHKTNRFLPGWKNHYIEELEDVKTERDIENIFSKHMPLKFTEEEEKLGRKNLNRFGLKDNDKFICLAVRDNAYNLIKQKEKEEDDFEYHSFRNANIDDFRLCAEQLADRGYFVFRMGVKVNKGFETIHPKIIDYANSDLRSDFMDVYLGAKCFFCISTNYGFQDIPYVFGVPIVHLTSTIGDLFTFNERNILLSKHHYSLKKKRNLNMTEIFSNKLAYVETSDAFVKKNVKLVDLSPIEITEAVLEMEKVLTKNKNLNEYESKLQKNFKELYKLNIEKFDYKLEMKTPVRALHGQIKARYSTEFLKKNISWLK